MYKNGACYGSHAHTMIQCHHNSHTYLPRCVAIIAHQYRLHQCYVIACTCITPSNLPIASGALSLTLPSLHISTHSLRPLPLHSTPFPPYLCLLNNRGVVHAELPRNALHQALSPNQKYSKPATQGLQLLDGSSQVISERRAMMQGLHLLLHLTNSEILNV